MEIVLKQKEGERLRVKSLHEAKRRKTVSWRFICWFNLFMAIRRDIEMVFRLVGAQQNTCSSLKDGIESFSLYQPNPPCLDALILLDSFSLFSLSLYVSAKIFPNSFFHNNENLTISFSLLAYINTKHVFVHSSSSRRCTYTQTGSCWLYIFTDSHFFNFPWSFPQNGIRWKTDLVEGRNNMLRRKTHESCIKHFWEEAKGRERWRGEVELSWTGLCSPSPNLSHFPKMKKHFRFWIL